MHDPVEAPATHREQPIVSAPPAWAAGQAAAYEHAIGLVRTAIGSLRRGDAKETIGRTLTSTVEILRGEAENAWKRFLDLSGHTSIRPGWLNGLHAEYDAEQETPMVYWPIDTSGREDAWGVVPLPVAEGEAIQMIAPFRPVVLRSLPEGTRCAQIRDPRHAALATTVEALQVLQRNTHAALVAATPADGWRRLRSAVTATRRSAAAATSVLAADEYVQWVPVQPGKVELDDAAATICQIAATAKAQRLQAVAIVSAWVNDLVDRVESDTPLRQRGERLQQQLTAALGNLQRTLSALNASLLHHAGIDDAAYRPMVVLRPLPEGPPVLVAVPVTAPNTVTAAPLRVVPD